MASDPIPYPKHHIPDEAIQNSPTLILNGHVILFLGTTVLCFIAGFLGGLCAIVCLTK